MNVAIKQNTQPRQSGAPWSCKEAAAFLGVSLRHLKALMSAGKVPFIKLGNRTLIADKVIRQIASEGV